MATEPALIDQAFADRCALIAQSYAGYFYGHPTRAIQHGHTGAEGGNQIDTSRPWQEPIVIADDCDFCKVTTDERVEERILGFQAAMDIEVLRGKHRHFMKWLERHPEFRDSTPASRRAFIRDVQDKPIQLPDRPRGWKRTVLDLTLLPFYLKRRLCIEWNHALRDYLAEESRAEFMYYDFTLHELHLIHKEQPAPHAPESEEARALAEDLADDYAYAATDPTAPPPSPAEEAWW